MRPRLFVWFVIADIVATLTSLFQSSHESLTGRHGVGMRHEGAFYLLLRGSGRVVMRPHSIKAVSPVGEEAMADVKSKMCSTLSNEDESVVVLLEVVLSICCFSGVNQWR